MSRTRVKICGITRPQDAVAAVEAGADALGLVFWAGSRRAVDEKRALEITGAIPPSIAVVGVFVDPNIEVVNATASRVSLNVVQLCGRVETDFRKSLPQTLRILRSIPVTDSEPALPSLRMEGVDDYLLDNGSTGKHGGTGSKFDWRLAGYYKSWGRIWLAGGLNPENVGAAIEAVRPHAVDVSGGVELSPGIKSPELIRSFVDAVRRADRAMATREQYDC